MCRYEFETARCGHPQHLKLFPCSRKSEKSAYHTVRHTITPSGTEECDSCIKRWVGHLLGLLQQSLPKDVEFFAFGENLQPYELPILWAYDLRQARGRHGTKTICPMPEAFVGQNWNMIKHGRPQTYILRPSAIDKPSPWNVLIGAPWTVPHFVEVHSAHALGIGYQSEHCLPHGRNAPHANDQLAHRAWFSHGRVGNMFASSAMARQIAAQSWQQGKGGLSIEASTSSKVTGPVLEDPAVAAMNYYRSQPLIVQSRPASPSKDLHKDATGVRHPSCA